MVIGANLFILSTAPLHVWKPNLTFNILVMIIIRINISQRLSNFIMPENQISTADSGIVQDVDVYYTEKAMCALSEVLKESFDSLPDDLKDHFDNALLNIAVNRIVRAEGPVTTATLLWRISDVLQSGIKPTASNPLEHSPH